jgi:predicted GNAT superfamily acetyltransferase
MRLRDYRSADLAAVHAINQAEVPAVGDETAEALATIAESSTIALVAEIDDRVAGFCLVLAPGADYGSLNYRWFSDRYDDFVYLDRIAIAPAFQRRGVGRAMYAEVERLAAERPAATCHFTLEVNLRPRNDTSLAFLAELGFIEVGQRETAYGTLVSLMAKPLPRASPSRIF